MQKDLKIILIAIIAFTIFIIAYFPAIKSLVTIWVSSENYNHAFLVLPIVVYIIWNQKNCLNFKNSDHNFIGLIVLILSVSIYYFSLLTQVNSIIFLSTFMTILGVLIYTAGISSVKKLIIPLFLILLLIPIPDQLYIKLTFPLQLKVSQMSEAIIRSLGVPILRQGNIMTIPGKSFEVVEACSGLRSIISILTLSVIAGYFILNKTKSKIILIVASTPTAILVNLTRVTTMVLVFQFFGIDLSEGHLHTFTGISIFGLAILIFMVIIKVLKNWEKI